MAPSNGSAKARKAGASKPQPKPVVPALPLKRQSAQATTATKAKVAPASGTETNATISKTESSKYAANGAAQEPTAGPATASSSPESLQKLGSLPASHGPTKGDIATNGQATAGE